MDSNLPSQTLDNADAKPSFHKPSNDAANRKYRRHSPVSGSASSMSDGSPNHGRSPSPISYRKDPAKKSDDRSRRGEERDLDRGAGRSRYGRSGDRHSNRHSHGSSHDYHRHDDYSKHHRRDDDAEKSYQKSSWSDRDSRRDTRSDHMRQESERSRDSRRNLDKHCRYEPDDAGHRSKDKERGTTVLKHHKYDDKDSSSDRVAYSKRHTTSNVNETKSGERDSHGRDKGGYDNRKDHPVSLVDYKNDHLSSYEESQERGKDTVGGRDNVGNRLKETHRSSTKGLDGQNNTAIEKRKYDDKDLDRRKERFSRETEKIENDYKVSSGSRERDGKNKQYDDKTIHPNVDQEASAKKLKVPTSEKDYAKDGQLVSKFTTSAGDERPRSSSQQDQETVNKVASQHVQSSVNEAGVTHDLNAAKVAAMKAAELVNRNLIGGGGGFMSTDQKKKLLWGNKKSTAAEEPAHRWDTSLFSDRERQEKFNKLMGVKGDLKPEHKPENKDGSNLLQAEKQEQLQMDLEKQYTAGLRRRDGRTVGLGL